MTEKKTLKLTPKAKATGALSLKNKATRSGSLSLNANKAKPSASGALSLNRKPSGTGSLSLKPKLGGTSSLSLKSKTGSLSLKRKTTTSSLSLKRTTPALGTDAETSETTGAPKRPLRSLRGKKRIVINTQAKRRPKPKPAPKPKPKPKPVPKPKKLPPEKKKKPIPPPTPKLPPPKEEEIQQLNEAMLAHFDVWRLKRPLQVKVKKQLRKLVKAKSYEALPCLHRRVVQALLRRHTRSEDYLNNIINGKHRYSLENEVVSDITDEEREFSKEYLEALQAAPAPLDVIPFDAKDISPEPEKKEASPALTTESDTESASTPDTPDTPDTPPE